MDKLLTYGQHLLACLFLSKCWSYDRYNINQSTDDLIAGSLGHLKRRFKWRELF